ncbi:hypothetical protein BO443_60297 [Burkholderia orbicola]
MSDVSGGTAFTPFVADVVIIGLGSIIYALSATSADATFSAWVKTLIRACRFQPECITRTLRRCRARFAPIVDVPFRFIGSHEAVPFVEAVRVAAAQCADANGHLSFVGGSKYLAQHGGANTLALMRGHDIQVVEQPVIRHRAERIKTRTRMVGFDEAAERRVERREKPVARTLRIETADALEAVAHRGDADRDEGVGVGLRDGEEGQGRCHRAAGFVRERAPGVALRRQPGFDGDFGAARHAPDP